jgi:hypothetical protein
MNSFSIPKPLFQPVRARRFPSAPQEAVSLEGRSMIKALGWTSTILVAGFLVWQVTVNDPVWPNVISAVLLVLISGLAGIRIGATGAAAYIRDVHRLNKVLAEQHQELEELNATLLKQMNAEGVAPATSEQT